MIGSLAADLLRGHRSKYHGFNIKAMFPAVNSQQRSGGKVSRKVPLKPRRSLVDWIRLTKSGQDLKGTGPRLLRIPAEELAKHNKPEDLWIALRGMVYNVTKYVEYHPGGADELMRGAGKDATNLFDEVHRWVNYESMLKECLIGKLIETHIAKNRGLKISTGMLAPPPPSATSLNPLGVNTMKLDTLKVKDAAMPRIELQDYTDTPTTSAPPPIVLTIPATPDIQVPSHDWYQTNKTIVFILYTKCSELKTHQIVCDIRAQKEILIDLCCDDIVYTFSISLHEEVCENITVSVTKSGKVQFTFTKVDSNLHWSKLGLVSRSKMTYSKREIQKLRFVDCTIESNIDLTHDTSLYHMKLPSSRWMQVPIGRHIYIRSSVEDIEIRRPYTPVLKSFLNENAESVFSDGEDLYLAIKHYSNGILTSALSTKKPGDKISISAYDGDFDFDNAMKFSTYIMLAAGTGVTPMIRVLYSIMHDRTDSQVHLLFFNKKEEDIVWRHEFDMLQDNFKCRFFIENILSRPADSWSGKRGRISKQLLEKYLEAHENVTRDAPFFFACGPSEFTKLAMGIVKDLGHADMHAFT